MIQTNFFDFDGVLVESVDIKTKAFASVVFEPEREDVVEKSSIIISTIQAYPGSRRLDTFIKKYVNEGLCYAEFLDALCQICISGFDAVVLAPYVKGR